MRGTVLLTPVEKHSRRITPADAGNSGGGFGGGFGGGDHPRGCGEQTLALIII